MFESDEYNFLKKVVGPGNTCIDVGANVGFFTQLFAAQTGSKGRVIAVEPILRNARLIELNSVINGTENIVHVVNKAVSESETGPVQFSLRGDSASSSIAENIDAPGRDNPLGTTTSKIVVESEPLDSIIQSLNINRIDILKMDIEGYEYRALKGMGRILADESLRPRVMMIELFTSHLRCFGNSIDQVVELLRSYGYSPRFVNKKGQLEEYKSGHKDQIYNVIFVL
jgi:FkbM family methyltransferase